MSKSSPFKWRHFEGEMLCVRWYLRYALSYRDLEEMMGERGLAVDHTTVFRWVQRYAPELDRRCGPYKYLNNIVEQDHRFIKRLVKPGLGFSFFHTAWRTLKGYEVMNMIRKGQLLNAERGDIVSQNRLVAQAFGLV